MEHRLGVRTNTFIPAKIVSAKGGSGPCEITQIGWHGLFVKTCFHHQLAVNTALEIEFALEAEGRLVRHRIRLLVIHAAANGFGAMFMCEAASAGFKTAALASAA